MKYDIQKIIIFVLILVPLISIASRPLIVAHRGGTADYPENTVLALNNALENGADMLEMSVQLSKDHVPVLYRPADLVALTDGHGKVSDKTLEQLQQLNAGWNFKEKEGIICYPYRQQRVAIPMLQAALRVIPPTVPIILDLKSLPAEPLVRAVARVLDQENAWGRVHLYSTVKEHLRYFTHYSRAQLFEARDITRTRLLNVVLAHICQQPPSPNAWVGIELKLPLWITEKFTLGESTSEVVAMLWNRSAVRCFKTQGSVKIFLFGVNTLEDYRFAKHLGVYGVMVDSPKEMRRIAHLR